MVQFRTGLTLESVEALRNDAEELQGITSEETVFAAGRVTKVEIKTDAAAQKIGRDKGRYITIQFDAVQNLSEDAFAAAVQKTAEEIMALCKFSPTDTVLVAALGNEGITPDALGPKCLDHLLVTRQLQSVAPHRLRENKLRTVAGIATNVFGVTGIESVEMVRGIAKEIKPDWIFVIDALATGEISRLCKTVQISNTAISPGGGVQNERPTLSADAVAAKMISIGMPTVMDPRVFCDDQETTDGLIVIPQQIDSAVAAGAKLLGFALNHALHYQMEMSEMVKHLA